MTFSNRLEHLWWSLRPLSIASNHLLKQKLNGVEISAIIGRGQSVVQEYVTQARTYHPELFETDEKDS